MAWHHNNPQYQSEPGRRRRIYSTFPGISVVGKKKRLSITVGSFPGPVVDYHSIHVFNFFPISLPEPSLRRRTTALAWWIGRKLAAWDPLGGTFLLEVFNWLAILTRLEVLRAEPSIGETDAQHHLFTWTNIPKNLF
jgi:hypothetical protein